MAQYPLNQPGGFAVRTPQSVQSPRCLNTGGTGCVGGVTGTDASAGTNVTPVAGTVYFCEINVPFPCVMKGIAPKIGSVGGTDNLIVALYDRNGALIANSALAGTLAGTANTYQPIPFTAPIYARPGMYFVLVQDAGTTSRLSAHTQGNFRTGSATGVFGTLPNPIAVVPGSFTTAVGPIAQLY